MPKQNARRFALITLISLCNVGTVLAQTDSSSQSDEAAYKEALARVQATKLALTDGQTNDLEAYEKFGGEVLREWRDRNKEYFARLTLELCGPLSSGVFGDKRQYQVARKYAAAALEHADSIPVIVASQLPRYLGTLGPGSGSLTEEEFAKQRLADAIAWLHAWKRLAEAVDPSWDPNDPPDMYVDNVPGVVITAPGMPPDRVEDPVLRARYEAAIAANRQRLKKHSEQYQISRPLSDHARDAESLLVKTYSNTPHNRVELQQLLDRYLTDQTAKRRIIEAVTANIEKADE